MSMELILLDDVRDLGVIGDRVKVADGFARNYLLPRSLAAPITKAALRRLEAKKLALQQEHEQRLSVARSMAEKICKESVTIPMEATEDEKLYGSVTGQQIVDALAEKGLQIDRHEVLLAEPIRALGVYTVEIRLHDEVNAAVKVWVVKK